MPKPRTEAREQRRAARRFAREVMVEVIRGVMVSAATVPPAARDAFLDEVRRTIDYVSRTRAPVHRPPLALVDTPAADEPG